MSEITTKEFQLVSELRERVSEINLDPDVSSNMYLVRFLRARDYKLKDVEQMLRKHIEWKLEKSLNVIVDWDPPQILLKNLQYELAGVDKDGVPLLLVPFGQWDVKGVIESVGKETYVRYVCWILLTFLKILVKNSKYHRFVLLMVPDGLQVLRQMSSAQVIESLLEICRIYEANCPETLKAAFIVDVPRLFSLGYRLVKPLIHSRTLAKMMISSDPNVWKPEILNVISSDQLPARLGGTRLSAIDIFNTSK